MRDAIVDKIHRIRERRAAKFKHNLHTMFEDLRRSEEQSEAQGAKFVTPKPRSASALDEIELGQGSEEPQSEPSGDPIVAEVRKYREANAERFGFDVRKIAEDARRRQATSGHPIVDLSRKGKRKQRRQTVRRTRKTTSASIKT